MQNKKKIFKFIIITTAAILLAELYFLWYKPKMMAQNAQTMQNTQKNLPEVSVLEIKKSQISRAQDLPARVSAYKIAPIRPQIDGVIRKVKFIEGSLVQAGEQLYQIDPVLYQASYENAAANFKTLESKRKRYQSLISMGAVSKQEIDDLEAAYIQAKSEATRARASLNYTKVLAPISGYIGKSNFTEGALVTTNQIDVLTTITQLSPIYIDMAQPSKDALQMGDQKDIEVSLITDEGESVELGVLKFSEMFVDESTDSVRLRAIFENKERKLLPGMFVTARLHFKSIEAITIPQRATNRGPDGKLAVFVVDAQGNVAMRQIQAERIYNDSWIVDDGLNEGDIVVVEGFQKIADKAKVRTVPYVAAGAPGMTAPAGAPNNATPAKDGKNNEPEKKDYITILKKFFTSENK